MKKLHLGLTIILVLTILLTIYLSFAVIVNAKSIQGYNPIGWGYIYVYFLFPSIIILFIGLSIYYAKTIGILGLGNLKWDFFLLTFFVIMFSLTGQLNKFYIFKDKYVISIDNKTDNPIEIFKIYGRHDLVEVRDLEQGRVNYIDFRGKNIDYKTKNHLENRILIDYYLDKEWNSKIIVDPWTVVTWDTLKIVFHKTDSVTASLYN
jgi:hypothetical protein